MVRIRFCGGSGEEVAVGIMLEEEEEESSCPESKGATVVLLGRAGDGSCAAKKWRQRETKSSYQP